jgi:glycosyltransferase involved in cell wall biosynthesis
MNRPLVSVILPVFNRAQCVGRAIESVLAQTYSNVELIIVDDGSTDGTAGVLERYRGAATILRQDNGGAYVARNLGLRHAKGELVAFVDSDDAWLPDKLELQVPLMRGVVGLVFGNTRIVTATDDAARPNGKSGFSIVRPNRGWVQRRFVQGNFVPTCTALVRRSALEEIGGFSEASRISADYLAWFRIAERHQFDFVEAPVALYTVHAGGISYDLGRSLAARIALFRAERDRTEVGETRRILDRLLFNLGLQLALAVVRGRAKAVDNPLRLARSTATNMDSKRAIWSIAAFATHQLRTRAARLLS